MGWTTVQLSRTLGYYIPMSRLYRRPLTSDKQAELYTTG